MSKSPKTLEQKIFEDAIKDINKHGLDKRAWPSPRPLPPDEAETLARLMWLNEKAVSEATAKHGAKKALRLWKMMVEELEQQLPPPDKPEGPHDPDEEARILQEWSEGRWPSKEEFGRQYVERHSSSTAPRSIVRKLDRALQRQVRQKG